MTLPIERFNGLPNTTVEDRVWETCIEDTRQFLADMEEEAFWQQGLAEIERLTGGNGAD
jgi:hypothetical protein